MRIVGILKILVLTMVLLLDGFVSVSRAKSYYNEEQRTSDYQTFKIMLDDFSSGKIEQMKQSAVLLRPLMEDLKKKYGINLWNNMNHTISTGDPELILDSMTLLILFATQDLIESIKRDQVGWGKAKDQTRKAILNYELITVRLKQRKPALDGRIKQGMNKLGFLLVNADLTTDPQPIEEMRLALISDLIRIRQVLDKLVVIVSLDSKIERISVEELKAIYRGEKKDWQDGSPIIPVDLEESDTVHELFVREIMNSTVEKLKLYWVQKIFSGHSPPLVLKSDHEVKNYVSAHPGSIGYIHAQNLDNTVKAILSNGKEMTP